MASRDNWSDWDIMTPERKTKILQVIDTWLTNGYQAIPAYQSIYPKANPQSASTAFCRIKKIPYIQEYIKQRRQDTYDASCIDLMRVTDEIARIAFCNREDNYIPSSVKLKALEMLQKAMREDAQLQAKDKQEEVVIGLEGDSDEDNSEEESI